MGEKAELYPKLLESHFKETDRFLAKGYYVQASERLWSAAAEIVKVVGAGRSVEPRTHRDLWEFVAMYMS